ncbi:MAG: DUF6364 family protein [Spirochaetia bacterium]|jgi:hypothetical protein|nr:DUF6364 family protein [Spirochaetia bacterium]
MKNITFSIDERLLKLAKEKASQEQKSLNQLFRNWLEEWTDQNRQVESYDKIMKSLTDRFDSGTHLSRDELNER